jgi:hypothetical protein
MRKILILFLFILLWSTVPAQVTVIESTPLNGDSVALPPASDTETREGQALRSPKKWDYGVELGTSAMFSGGYGSGFSTWVSPHAVWQPSQRFRINAGFSIVNSTLFGYKPYYYWGADAASGFSGNFTHALLYIEGQYLITKDLQFSGSLYADVPLTGSDPSNPYSNSNFQGMSMQFKYRIGEHATIEAGFNYMRNEGPWNYNPFNPAGSVFYNPFQTAGPSPFNW